MYVAIENPKNNEEQRNDRQTMKVHCESAKDLLRENPKILGKYIPYPSNKKGTTPAPLLHFYSNLVTPHSPEIELPKHNNFFV